MLEANGTYTKVQTNFMTDGGVAVYEKGSEKDWKQKWLIAYYPASNKYGPGWYIQQGVDSCYKSKISKDPEQFPAMTNVVVPANAWTLYQGDHKHGAAVRPVPTIEKAADVRAAISLLQHLLDDKGAGTLSRDICSQISTFAEEARRLKLPGAVQGQALWEGAKAIKPYNEVRGPRGKCRPAYASVVEIMEKVMEEDRKKGRRRIDDFPSISLKDFRGDNRLYHIPRMLTNAETDMLVRGIAQRGKAYRAFILDMTKSAGVEKMSCVHNKALPEDVFRRVAARAAHKMTYDLVDKSKLSDFYWNVWFGPDIIRGPDEKGGYQFYVVEDNFCYVGGFGDLIESRKVLLKTFPELLPAIGDDQTAVFYDEMAKHYHAQVNPGEKVVVLYYRRRGGGDVCADNEDKRMADLFKRRGIIPVVIPGDEGPKPDEVRVEVRGKKVILVTPHADAKHNGLPSRSPVKDRVAPSRSPIKERPPRSPAPSPSPPRKQPEKTEESSKPQRKSVGGAEESAKKRQRITGATEEPVGLVILLSEAADVQPGHASTKLKSAIENAKSHIEIHESEVKEAVLKAKGAEKSVSKVSGKVDVTDKAGCKSSLQMKGKKLVWIVHDKDGNELDRMNGPFGWNLLHNKLVGLRTKEEKSFACFFDAENVKVLEKAWTLDDLPYEAARAQFWVDELKAAVEKVGQLVDGYANDNAPDELFRLLRLHDKEAWKNLMQGKRGVPNLLEAYYSGGVKLANGPGFVILDDKELCSHVENLVQYYLGEEPILKNIPTRSFAAEPDLLHSVFDDPRTQENVVVKRVDGRGGDAVWVGAKLSRTDFLAARPLAEAEPDAFIVQKYTALSQVDGHLVDLRGPAFISSTDDMLTGGPGISVSPVLWGRGVPDKGGNGKVNISDAGFQFTIATSAGV